VSYLPSKFPPAAVHRCRGIGSTTSVPLSTTATLALGAADITDAAYFTIGANSVTCLKAGYVVASIGGSIAVSTPWNTNYAVYNQGSLKDTGPANQAAGGSGVSASFLVAANDVITFRGINSDTGAAHNFFTTGMWEVVFVPTKANPQ